jgi:hypothetical protein
MASSFVELRFAGRYDPRAPGTTDDPTVRTPCPSRTRRCSRSSRSSRGPASPRPWRTSARPGRQVGHRSNVRTASRRLASDAVPAAGCDTAQCVGVRRLTCDDGVGNALPRQSRGNRRRSGPAVPLRARVPFSVPAGKRRRKPTGALLTHQYPPDTSDRTRPI